MLGDLTQSRYCGCWVGNGAGAAVPEGGGGQSYCFIDYNIVMYLFYRQCCLVTLTLSPTISPLFASILADSLIVCV